MKRKVVMLLAWVMCLSVLLASCGERELGVKGIYKSTVVSEAEDVIYPKAVLRTDLNDMIIDSTAENLILFTKENALEGETKVAVLNTDTGNIVFCLTEQEGEDVRGTRIMVHSLFANSWNNSSASDEHWYYDYTLSANTGSTGDGAIIRVTERSYSSAGKESYTYRQTLYTALGEKILSKQVGENENIKVEKICDTADGKGVLCLIDDKVYEIREDVATYCFEVGFSDISSEKIGYYINNRFYRMSGREVYVYDSNFKLMAYYAIPAGWSSDSKHILSNGNVLLQFSKKLDEDERNYDYKLSDTKYELCTVLFDIQTEKAKELDFDCYVSDVQNKVTDPEFFEKTFVDGAVENLVTLSPIVDKAIDNLNKRVACFDNKMRLKGYLGAEISNQESVAEPLGNNRFAVTNKADQKFLIDQKGNVLGEISGATYDATLGLFVKDGKYYDLDLKQVFDENEIEYACLGSGNGYTLYLDSEKEIYYIQRGISLTKLNIPKDAFSLRVYDDYFCYEYIKEIEDWRLPNEQWVVYCNAKGETIYSVNTQEEYYVDHTVMVCGNSFVVMIETEGFHENIVRYYIAN